MSRQQTPDIMANLMSGSVDLNDVKQENHKAIKQVNNTNHEHNVPISHSEEQESNKTIKLPKNKAICKDGNKEIIEMKEKATFNLSKTTLETLEDSWIKLKRQFKGEQRITKTAIVEMALDICISEFEDRGAESMLYKKLADLRNTAKLDDNSSS